jgi:hypothetical protein
VFDVALHYDLQSNPIVRAIFWMRSRFMGSTSEPAPSLRLNELTRIGWGVLARTPGRELVMGAVTEPWHADVKFHPLAPEDFTTYCEPGLVKIVWTLEVEPMGANKTRLRTQTRALATNGRARRRFMRYWRLASPGILLIRRVMLPDVRRAAERMHEAWAV